MLPKLWEGKRVAFGGKFAFYGDYDYDNDNDSDNEGRVGSQSSHAAEIRRRRR